MPRFSKSGADMYICQMCCRSCGRCGKDIFEDDDIQLGTPTIDAAVCHECWHALNPTAYCLVCDRSGAKPL